MLCREVAQASHQWSTAGELASLAPWSAGKGGPDQAGSPAVAQVLQLRRTMTRDSERSVEVAT